MCQVNTQAQSSGARATSLSLSVTPRAHWPSSWPSSGKSCLMAKLELKDTHLGSNPGCHSLSGQVRPGSQEAWPGGQGMSLHGLQACPGDRGQTSVPCESGAATGGGGHMRNLDTASCSSSAMTCVTLGFCFPFSRWEGCTGWPVGPVFLLQLWGCDLTSLHLRPPHK